MGNPIEDVKGKAKEAAGALSDSESLKREGQSQQRKSDRQEDAARAERTAEEKRAEAASAEAEQRRNE
jgi:uncharacterized protein YjbJ (UPF0337 family)